MFADIARIFATPLRIKLVKFFALQSEEKFKAADVPRMIGGGKAKVRAEISALARAGLLTPRAGQGGTTYQWNKAHRLALPIATFIESAAVPKDIEIASLFKRMPSITAVLSAGTLVGESRSSVDLLIISRQPGDPRVPAAVKKLEVGNAMPIRFAVMSQREFEDRRESYDRLLRDVMDFNYKVVYGKIAGIQA